MAATTTLSPGEIPTDVTDPSTAQEEGWTENNTRKVMCPDCAEDPPNVIEDWAEGNVVCASCGLVLETHLVDQRSEWRTFAADDGKGDDPSRVGKAEDPNDPTSHGLQTQIGFNAAGQRDRTLDRAHATMYKEGGIQALEIAFGVLRGVCTSLNVPHVTTQVAEELYRSCFQHQLLRGKTMKSIIAACVLLSCRRNHNGLGYQDVAGAAEVTQREVSRAVKAMKVIHKHDITQSRSTNAAASDAASLCGRYGSELDLSPKSLSLARKLASHVSDVGTLDGRNPNTTAGACLFMASQLQGETPKTFKQCAKTANVNDSTIRGAYKKLLDERDKVVKSEWLGEGRGDLKRLPAA